MTEFWALTVSSQDPWLQSKLLDKISKAWLYSGCGIPGFWDKISIAYV